MLVCPHRSHAMKRSSKDGKTSPRAPTGFLTAYHHALKSLAIAALVALYWECSNASLRLNNVSPAASPSSATTSTSSVSYSALRAEDIGASSAPRQCRRASCEKGYYEGTWVHRPNRTRDEVDYTTGDAFGCPEVDFRRLYPGEWGGGRGSQRATTAC